MPVGAHHEPELAAAVERLCRFPSDLRRYDITKSRAAESLGIDSSLLVELQRLGLPYRADGTDERYHFGDLAWIALQLGLASPLQRIIRIRARTLERLGRRDRATVTLQWLPPPRVRAGTVGELRLPTGERRSVTLTPRIPAFSMSREIRLSWPEIPREFHRLLAEIAAFDVMTMPEGGDNCGVTRLTGFADCGTAALIFLERCRAAELEARLAFGVLITTPFSALHLWPEVAVGAEWVPVDPLMMGQMHRFASLSPDDWPLSRSPGAILWRFGDAWEPLLLVDGESVGPMLLTKLDEGAAVVPSPVNDP